jgi:probable rRNA maturation factor
MAGIEFFSQDLPFKPSKPQKTKRWIREVILREGRRLLQLNYIFCSDEHLLTINRQYLQHNTLTDIITFDNSENPNDIEGDIFISIERVEANAQQLGTNFDEELHRVLIHGVLHLMGYRDKTPKDKSLMRKKEDACLSLRSKI